MFPLPDTVMRMRRKLAPAFNMSDMDSVIEALTKLKVFELDSGKFISKSVSLLRISM